MASDLSAYSPDSGAVNRSRSGSEVRLDLASKRTMKEAGSCYLVLLLRETAMSENVMAEVEIQLVRRGLASDSQREREIFVETLIGGKGKRGRWNERLLPSCC
jgi:hypothetical protein